MTPPAFPYPILYSSPRLVVVNKPPGLPVHPGPRAGKNGRPTLEDALPALSRRPDGPWLVHRLDADTAGCVLIALRKQALIAAQQAFQSRQTRKTYWAVVTGHPSAEKGDITTPLTRQDTPSGWHIMADPSGQPAHTRYRVLAHTNGLSWLELTLLTGRTHQARVHCAHLGTPILGDSLYNPAARPGDALHLLARRLQLTLPSESIDATAEPPPAMQKTLALISR